MRQRLAAVMAADIVGYTRLMATDQKATLAALTAFRAEVFSPSVAGNSGTIIKSMGDGWLVEFSSVADAVACALHVQEALAAHATLRLRIGINIGDVLHQQEDIFGDGVNIAARLQEIAPAAGIALSGAAYSALDGTLAPGFADAGMHDLKHVARPVQVWMRRADVRDASVLSGHTHILAHLTIPPCRTVPEHRGFDDLADTISGDLARLVRSSDWIQPRISAEPGDAEYVLATNLRVQGERMRLEVALQTTLGETVWQGAFDGEVSNTFDWQDRVCLSVAANVVGALADHLRAGLFDRSLSDLSAPDCLRCAVLEFFEISDEALVSALGYVDSALCRDPDYAPIYPFALRCLMAGRAAGYRRCLAPWTSKLACWLTRAEAFSEAPLIGLCRAMQAYGETRDTVSLELTLDRAFAQSPSDPDLLCLGGWCLVWLGRPARAIECFRRFERLGRFNSLSMAVRGGLATALVMAERDSAAIQQAQSVLRATREFSVPLRALAAAAAHAGLLAEAQAAAQDALQLVPGDTIEALRDRSGFADTPATRRFFDGLSAAGYPR